MVNMQTLLRNLNFTRRHYREKSCVDCGSGRDARVYRFYGVFLDGGAAKRDEQNLLLQLRKRDEGNNYFLDLPVPVVAKPC